MCLLDLFLGVEGGWESVDIGGLKLGGSNAELWGDDRNKKLLMNNSVEVLIPFNEGHQGLLKLHIPSGWGVEGGVSMRENEAILSCNVSGKLNISRVSLREFDITYMFYVNRAECT